MANATAPLDVLLVLGKGRRERTLPFGHKAGEALDRYLRARARHKDAHLPWLWLGKKGRLTEWGLVQMLQRRGAQAGAPGAAAPPPPGKTTRDAQTLTTPARGLCFG